MCTLLLLHRCFPEAPLVVGANRDEYLDRPAEPPTLRALGERRIVAPRDQRAGGTWLGLNDRGVFAALTNRPVASPDRTLRSRGLLVEDALRAESAKQAAEAHLSLPADAYNPFNLVVCDGLDAFVVVYDGAPRLERLEPGAHVIGNADPNDAGHPKVARLLEEIRPVAAGPIDGALEGLSGICRAHTRADGRLGETCIHTEAYGTRSSTLLTQGSAGPLLHFADGAPCETPYEDLTPLLHDLGQPAASATEPSQRNPA